MHRLAVVAIITMFVCVCAGLKPDGEMKLRAVYDFTGSGVNEATVCEFVCHSLCLLLCYSFAVRYLQKG